MSRTTSKKELAAHVNKNMCLAYFKYKSKVFRDATAHLRKKSMLPNRSDVSTMVAIESIPTSDEMDSLLFISLLLSRLY